MFVCAYICIYLPEANSMQRKGLEMSFIKRRFGHDTLICVYFFEEKKPPYFLMLSRFFIVSLIKQST